MLSIQGKLGEGRMNDEWMGLGCETGTVKKHPKKIAVIILKLDQYRSTTE